MRASMVRVVDLIKNKGDGGVLPPKGLSSYSNNYASDADRVSFVAVKSSEKSPMVPTRGVPFSKGAAGGAKSISAPTCLGEKTKFCSFLGGRKYLSKIIDYPSVANVCYG
jgi:hypothetical protein